MSESLSTPIDLLCKEYFAHIAAGKDVYAMVVLNQFGKPQIYTEPPPKGQDGYNKMRIFMRKLDYFIYVKSIAAKENIDYILTKRLDATAQEFVSIAMDLDDILVKKGKKGIQVIATMIDADDMVDVDVFWTKNNKQVLL